MRRKIRTFFQRVWLAVFFQRRTMMLAFSGTLPPGKVTSVSAPSHVYFRPERLVIPATSGDGVIVESIGYGLEPGFVTNGGLPASVFAVDAKANGIRGPIMYPGVPVGIMLRNTTDREIVFSAAMMGSGWL